MNTQPVSLEWNHDGELIGCVSKDKMIHIFDPKTYSKAIVTPTGHNAQQMKWIGNTGQILTMGSSTYNDGRQYSIFDVRSLANGPVVTRKLDNNSFGGQFHYDQATNLIFMTNRGQNMCQYFHYNDGNLLDGAVPSITYLDKYTGKSPCYGMTFLPNRCLHS